MTFIEIFNPLDDQDITKGYWRVGFGLVVWTDDSIEG